jgi:hypothetical protein
MIVAGVIVPSMVVAGVVVRSQPLTAGLLLDDVIVRGVLMPCLIHFRVVMFRVVVVSMIALSTIMCYVAFLFHPIPPSRHMTIGYYIHMNIYSYVTRNE